MAVRTLEIVRMRPVTRKSLAYLLALMLPLMASYLTSELPVLKSIPFGLYYISIAVVGILGGTWPSLLAALLCAFSRNLMVLPAHSLLAFDLGDLVRVPTLVAQALLVSLLNARRKSSREHMERALKVLQERSDALVETLHASKCASWVLDLDGDRVTQFYKGSYQIFGRPFAEIEAANAVTPFLHPDDLEAFAENRREMRETTAPIRWEYRVPWPNGELHWLEMRATRVPGKRCVWRGVTVDITERKLAETAMLRQEKLAAMGRLASTVAHEINNPLEAVTNLLYLMRSDTAMEAETRAYLRTAETELARLGDITRLTLGFVRTGAAVRSVEIAAITEEVFAIFRHRYEAKRIVVERSIEPGVCVRIAPHELRQVLTNLISNAADALTVEEPRVVIRIGTNAGMAVFELEDNGSGIPQEQLGRIFEPFFTTKQDVGTGIGLWVTRELVENNGGSIMAESGDLGGGIRTRFRVEFPLAGVD